MVKWSQDWMMIYLKSHNFRKKICRLNSYHFDFKCIILQYTLYTLDSVILFQWAWNIRKHSWFKSWLSSVSEWHMNFSQGGYSFLFFLAKQFDCLLLLLSERESLLSSYIIEMICSKRVLTISAKLKTWMWNACKCLYFREQGACSKDAQKHVIMSGLKEAYGQ